MANISWLKWPDLVIAFGEQQVLTDLKTSPPTYIAIVYHDFLEFGTRFFGKDFGKDIFQWVPDLASQTQIRFRLQLG